MRVLVTGGAGYIGSVVVEELVRDGHEVIVYDNLSKGHRAAVPKGVDLVESELSDVATLQSTLKSREIEGVIHMAAHSVVGESVKQPAKYYHNNLTSGLSLLDAMREAQVKRLVFSSTAAVYGEPAKQPIDEDDPTGPTNPYGETKLSFERAMHWSSQADGLRYASLRYFNAAGATADRGEWHDPESHLIPLVLQVAAGQRDSVEIFGDDYPTRDGTCVRDYIHVVDLARAHILALGILDKRNVTYNLGCGGEGYSVKEVIELARKVTGRKIHASISARREGDPAVLVADSKRIKEELGWSPQYQDLRKIIDSAWTWLQARPNGYASD
ncbi:MAG: UDP-glucose 4-epimerase GalE [bacterium]